MTFLEDLFELSNKTAIVAGGAGTIGTVMSEALLKAGANVVVWSRTQASIDMALDLRVSPRSFNPYSYFFIFN